MMLIHLIFLLEFFGKNNIFNFFPLTLLKFFKSKFFLTVCFLFIIFSVLGIIYFGFIAIAGEEGKLLIQNNWVLFKEFLIKNGFWLFLSLAILPGFILPCAPLLFLAGVWGTTHGPWLACLYSVLALSINLVWTYWFAYGVGRTLVNKLLKYFKYSIPEVPSGNLLQWAIILRLTPGIPLIFTNYGLGLLKIPFYKYLIVSIPIIAITDCGFVLASAGIVGGSWKYIWGGFSIIIIMILLGRSITKTKNHAD